MPVDTNDIRGNSIIVGASDSQPMVFRRNATTIVVALSQDEALALIRDIAAAAWSEYAYLVVETEQPTYPREV